MDREILRRILSFIAQQKGFNSPVLKSLLSVLPLPKDDFLLKKFNLLCKILSQIDEDVSITEDMLHWLEELDSLKGGVASVTASLSKAYRAVAVECTAMYLPGKVDENSKYFDALERIWRDRIRLMEQVELGKRSALLTDELFLWRTRLEAALSDQSVLSELLWVNVRTEAFMLLKAYLDEELENLLPLRAVPAKNTSDCENKGGAVNISPNQSSPPRGNIRLTKNRKRQAPFKAAKVLRRRPNRGVRISDEDELETEISGCTAAVTGKNENLQQGVAELPKSDKHNRSSNLDGDASAAKVQERVQSSNLVTSPLPDPQKVTESPSSDKHERSSNLEQDVNGAEEQVAPEFGYMEEDPLPYENKGVSDHEKDVDDAEEQVAPRSGYMAEDPLPDQNKGVSDPPKDVNEAEEQVAPQSGDLLKKNQPCGRRKLPTYTWVNSADRARQAKPNSMPQEKSDPETKPSVVPTRRFNRSWSSEEEATLLKGVQKFGEGQWKLILDCYSESFDERTTINLKDKWRNMMRPTHPLPRI